MVMMGVAKGENLPWGIIESCESGCGFMADIILNDIFYIAHFHGEKRLNPIRGFNLALFHLLTR